MITRGNFSRVKRGMVGGWKSYYFTEATNPIRAVRGNKWLKFDNVGVFSLSLDNGATYPITLDLTGVCDIISRAKIYPNGNIMWTNQTTAYYSTDNLATYHESIVTNENGTPFVPDTYDNFKQESCDAQDVTINGVYIDCWGVYSIHSTAINAWYTTDSGIHIKSCYKNNSTISGQNIRHIHAINYNTALNEFIMEFGDAVSGWNRGTYNTVTDAWTWTNIVTEDGSGYHKSTGMQFHSGYAYWTSDSTDAAKKGVWKCAYANIGTGTDYTKIRDLSVVGNNLYGTGGIMIVANIVQNKIDMSVDYGITWEQFTLTGGPVPAAGFSYIGIDGPDSNYFFRADIQENPVTEPEYNSSKGIVLMMQIIPTAGSN